MGDVSAAGDRKLRVFILVAGLIGAAKHDIPPSQRFAWHSIHALWGLAGATRLS